MTGSLAHIRYEHRMNGDVPIYVMAVLVPQYTTFKKIVRRANVLRDMTGHTPVSEVSIANALDALVERRLAKADGMGRYALGDVIEAKAWVDARVRWGEACEAEEVRKGVIRVRPAIREVLP